jgi:hypothetical protein
VLFSPLLQPSHMCTCVSLSMCVPLSINATTLTLPFSPCYVSVRWSPTLSPNRLQIAPASKPYNGSLTCRHVRPAVHPHLCQPAQLQPQPLLPLPATLHPQATQPLLPQLPHRPAVLLAWRTWRPGSPQTTWAWARVRQTRCQSCDAGAPCPLVEATLASPEAPWTLLALHKLCVYRCVLAHCV